MIILDKLIMKLKLFSLKDINLFDNFLYFFQFKINK